MDYKMIFGLLGGLGLFVYGMKLMGDGLQKAAGDKLKKVLEALTSKTIFAILVGAVVAGIIQSSSATTVMTIGFVNAGLMNLFQATGVIMGANIGTTITAQLIAFKLTDVAPLVLAIGAATVLFSKKKKTKDIGDIILGFGILFIGMSMMESSMKPLGQLPMFKHLIISIGSHPLLGILVGLGMTATVQSSSATIGILMALASNGAIGLNVALPILFGDNIGTCVTALLAGIGTHKNAKRASIIHLTFNTIGTIIFMTALPLVLKLVPLFGGNIERQIANAHTLFNISNVLIQAPFIPLLVKFVNKVVPGKDTDETVFALEYLDKRLLETPSIACGQVVKEICRMGKIAENNLEEAMSCFMNDDENLIQSVVEHENLINFLHREITDYMVSLSNTNLSERQSELITSLFHVVSDIERVGDHADNIVELAEIKINDSLPFSKESLDDIQNMYEITKSAVNRTLFALENFNIEAAREVLDIESNIDLMEKQLRQEHVNRLNTRTCNAVSASIFVDLLTNFERVGDHSNNIAQMVIEQKS